ncbi:MAG: alpha/beta hydrolase-fold protein [Puia sp.]|nr:alpha/beta hydrolase-fold protein [Puia sp.]
MMKTIAFPGLLILLVLSGAFAAGAQNPASWCPVIQHDSLYSDTLKEERPIQVILPEKYQAGSSEKYDVLYVLDGDWNTKLGFDVTRFVESANFIPHMMIVSIPNIIVPNGPNLRQRDYTPSHVGYQPESGGADRFLSFLKNELIPYINKKYPSTGKNTLWGTSLGGLVTVYAILADPSPFESYIANDPSLWWDNGYVTKLAIQKKEALRGLRKTLWINGRDGQGLIEMGIAPMDTILPPAGPGTALHWKLLAYPFETHLSEIFKGSYDGIKYSYTGYSAEDLVYHPMNGILLKDKPVRIFPIKQPWSEIHYTTDGSEPTPQSPVIDSVLSLSGPANLIVRSFCYHPEFDRTFSGKFTVGEPLKPVASPRNTKPGGWHYGYYAGDWKSLPDFKKLKPVLSGVTKKSLETDTLAVPQTAACVLTGWLEVKEDGYYMFVVKPHGATTWWLGDQSLFDYDGVSGQDQYRSFTVPLVKGFYPVRLETLLKKGERLPLCLYQPPGHERDDPQPFDAALLYSNER